MKEVIQTELQSGTARMVCWLPVDKRVRIGSVISLKGDDIRWKVTAQYERLHINEINRGWNNNI